MGLVFASLLGAAGAYADPDPYVVGGPNDPNQKEAKAEDADGLGLRLDLIHRHRYDERFAVQHVAVSTSGREIAASSGVSGRGPSAWDLSTGNRLQLPPMPQTVSALAYSQDHQWLAAAVEGDVLQGQPSGIQLYALDNGRPGPRLEGIGRAHGLAFSPDGSTLAVATADGGLVWDLRGGQVALFARGEETASAQFVAPDRLALAGRGGGSLRLYRLPTGEELDRFTGPQSNGPSAFSPTGRVVVLAADDGVELVDLGGRGIQKLVVDGQVTAADWGDSGGVLALGLADGQVLVYAVDGMQPVEGGPTPRLTQGEPAMGWEDAPGSRSTKEVRKQADERGLLVSRQTDKAGGLGGPEGGSTVRHKPSYRVVVLDQMSGDPRTGASMERKLSSNSKRLEACWRREERKGRVQAGQLRWSMTITPNGEGLSFDLQEDRLDNLKVQQCLEERLREALFPPGLGSLEVELTLALQAD